jgi:uracil-DNA glycosylase family 4
MPVAGKGRRKILVVGEAPGETEDRTNRPFVGKAGRYLRRALDQVGVDLDEDCWTTNALICRPPDNKIKDENAVEYCRPNLLREIDRLKPQTVVLLGATPVKSLIGFLWKESVGTISRWVGWNVPCQRFNCWVCPANHPSYLIRLDNPLADRLFLGTLRKAFAHDRRPWDTVPDYRDKVEVEFDTDKAAGAVLGMVGKRPVAFDFETNMLKPDSDAARIVCCSVSDGRRTVAYPWYGAAVRATKALVESGTPLIASNMKFEDRWTRKVLKAKVRNWNWDTMLAAHVIDNRPDITSIKFQAFALLGQESYDDHVKPYLESRQPGGYSKNRVTQVDMRDLMLYCGLDSLLEWKVAHIQKRRLGFDA